jgi:hypothetical protein
MNSIENKTQSAVRKDDEVFKAAVYQPIDEYQERNKKKLRDGKR